MKQSPLTGLDLKSILSRLNQAAGASVLPYLRQMWGNSLAVKERRDHPLPANLMTRILPITAGALALLPIIAWVINIRLISAVLLGICLAAAALPVLAAPMLGAMVAPAARDQSTFTSMSPDDAAIGSVLVALWRLRWPVVIGLMLTPALVISLLRLDTATFSAYHDTVTALGSAAPVEEVQLLLPGGAIPWFRLLIRGFTAGLLPWVLLPMTGALGLGGALLMDDVTFGQIAGLIVTVVIALVAGGVWSWLSLTPIFAGMLEIVRLALVGGLLAGLLWLAILVSRQNARLLLTR